MVARSVISAARGYQAKLGASSCRWRRALATAAAAALLPAAAAALAGCTSTGDGASSDPDATAADLTPARAEPSAPPQVIEVPLPTALPQLRSAPPAPTPRPKAIPPADAIRRAQRDATQRSTPDGFTEATQVFPFLPGGIYEVYCAPGRLTAIVLQPGERLNDVAAGDTERWVIGETVSGKGDRQQTVVLVKPIRPNLVNNLVITTDRRLYLLDAKSVVGVYNSAIVWTYPQDDARLKGQRAADAARREAETIAAPAVPLDHLNYGYAIEMRQGREPAWKPVEVFDDGQKTYIRFSARARTAEKPPLFIVGAGGRGELVNYRVRGDFYIVDRLIEVAELRLGEAPQTVVRIHRTAADADGSAVR